MRLCSRSTEFPQAARNGVRSGLRSGALLASVLALASAGLAQSANPEKYLLGADAPLSVTAPGVTGNDTGLTTHQTYVKTNPTHGALNLQTNGAFTYTPTAGYTGTDSFQYWIDIDGQAGPTPPVSSATVSLEVKLAGNLATWGSNQQGEGSVPSGSYIAISAGQYYSIALRKDGTIAAWGDNSAGQLDVPAGQFIKIDAGQYHCLAIRADGTLVGWGRGTEGQTTCPPGTFTDIATGGFYSLAVRTDGTLAAWGENYQDVTTVPTGTFSAVAAGVAHALGLRTDGTLEGWGLDSFGQAATPPGTYTALDGGTIHSLAIATDGTAVGWGYNGSGECSPPGDTFIEIEAGNAFSLGLRTDGTLAGWGYNNYGQANPPLGTFLAVAGGFFHGLAIATPTPPEAVNDSFETKLNTTLNTPATGVLTNDIGEGAIAVQTEAPTHASSFTLATDGSFTYTPANGFTGTDTFKYKASNASGQSNEATVTITVKPILSTLTLAPTSLIGGASSSGTLTLQGGALVGGTSIALSSNNAAAQVPTSATIAQSATSTTFTVTTSPVTTDTTATITATYDGTTKTATLTILAPLLSDLTLTPTTTNGGSTVSGKVKMTGQVAGATPVSMTYPSGVTGPSAITINSGASEATATLTAAAVPATTTVTITATRGAITKTAQLTIRAALLNTLSIAPSTMVGGNNTTGTVTLTGAIPPAGISIALSDNSGSITTPASVPVAQVQSTANFTISTSLVSASATRQVTATFDGVTKTANLTLQPPPTPQLASLTFNPSTLVGGLDTIGTVTTVQLVGANTTVNLTDNSSALIPPASVVIPQGSSTANFTLATQAVGATATRAVTASLNSTTRTANVTLTPFPGTGSFAITPSSVYEGHTVNGIVKRFGSATLGPATYSVLPYGGTSVFILPSSVTIPSGRTSAAFTIGTNNVGNVAATRGVSVRNDDNVSQTAFVTIQPIMPASVSLSPNSVTGGQPVTATVNLTATAGVNGTPVQTLTASNLSMPATVTIPAGQASTTFTVSTSVVTSSINRDVTVRRNNVTKSATLTIRP